MPPAPSLVLAVALVALVAWALYARAADRRRFERARASLRAAWGRPKEGARDVGAVARYHDARRAGAPSGVDASTWRDLDMDAVFAHVDRTSSFAGAARLYDRLRTPEGDLGATRRFDEVATVFGRDAAAREQVQAAFAGLNDYGQSGVLEAFLGKLPAPIAAGRFFPILALLTAVALVASLAFPMARVALLALAAASIALRVTYGRRGLASLDTFRKAAELLDVGRKLAKIDHPELAPEIGALRRAMQALEKLGRATSWLLIDALRANELVAIAVTYVNVFFLLDLTAMALCLEAVHGHRAELHALFAVAGDLDAAVAVASFRAGLPSFSRPAIEPGGDVLELEAATHPLVERPVPNGIRVEERGVLVTGGNMSGKSTFVRTVAINALLAQTIYTTLATRYRGPILRVRTLMSASDDVQRSRSYYYAELEAAKTLLAPDASGTRTLVVLDELFRGTNTSERIGAGKAVLDALVRAGHFVFASTHDRELVDLLAERFDPYHFGEDVVANALVFPYDLRRGPSTTRNAIVLMRIAGFPLDVVADATRTVEALD